MMKYSGNLRIVFSTLIFLCNSISPNFAFEEVLPTTKPSPWDYNCYDSENRPYTDVIPHPTNCTLFLKCVPDIHNRPYAVPQFCPVNLWFNFDTCNCDYPDIAVCYDLGNPDHVRDTFKCACPLVKDENGDYTPTPNDDRCPQL